MKIIPYFYRLLVLVALTRCAHVATPKAAPKIDLAELRETVAVQSDEIERLRSELRKMQLRDAAPPKPKSKALPVVVLRPETPAQEEEGLEEDTWGVSSEAGNRVAVADIEPESNRASRPALRDRDWKTIVDSRHDSMPLYFRGLQMYRSRNFDGALEVFSRFIQAQPNHVYSDRAQFYVAESHFQNGDYTLALKSTHLLENKYPYSFRIPETLHRRALSLVHLGQTQRAMDVWRDLLRRFPAEPVAETASHRLAELLGVQP
jgi:TolA-binding protein